MGWMDRYVGSEVDVLYLTDNGAYRDRGVLAAFGEGWIELQKGDDEVFLVPITAIRLVKVVRPVQQTDTTLLRPAPGPDPSSPVIGRLPSDDR